MSAALREARSDRLDDPTWRIVGAGRPWRMCSWVHVSSCSLCFYLGRIRKTRKCRRDGISRVSGKEKHVNICEQILLNDVT